MTPSYYDPLHLNIKIKSLMEAHKITLSKLSEETGVPVATIKRLESDSKANPTISTLIPIAHFFNISLNELIDISDDKPIVSTIEYDNRLVKVPVFAMNDLLKTKKKHTSIGCVYLESENPDKKFAIYMSLDFLGELEGESLSNTCLIINAEKKPKNRSYILVEKISIKKISLKILLIEDDILYLKPINKDFKSILFSEDYRIIGVVEKIIYSL